MRICIHTDTCAYLSKPEAARGVSSLSSEYLDGPLFGSSEGLAERFKRSDLRTGAGVGVGCGTGTGSPSLSGSVSASENVSAGSATAFEWRSARLEISEPFCSGSGLELGSRRREGSHLHSEYIISV